MLLGAGRPCPAPSRKGRAAFALRRADVNLLTKTISVSRSLKDVNGRQIFGPTKTHEHRTVAILGFLATLLRQHLAQPLGGVGPDALVFVQRNGNPIRHGNFYRRHFKPAARAALPPELHNLRFHDLRHTAASLAVAAGAHPKVVQRHLGHSSIQVTLDRYTHLFPNVEESLAEALDALYDAPTASPGQIRSVSKVCSRHS